MADIASRLTSIKGRLTELANLADNDRAEAAHQLATQLIAELDQIIAEASPPSGDSTGSQATPPRPPRHDVERCPICSLRSLTFQKGTFRQRNGGYEAFYRCLSCAHEEWREVV